MSTIVGWTGHRPDIFHDPSGARGVVAATAQELVANDHAERFLVGGQRGVDTWAAEAAIALGVPFTLILPLSVTEFTSDWSADDRATLETIIGHALEVRVVGGDPDAAYTERNRQVASQADLLVAVWTRFPGGGTAETIALARTMGTPVREILLPVAQMAHSPHSHGI